MKARITHSEYSNKVLRQAFSKGKGWESEQEGVPKFIHFLHDKYIESCKQADKNQSIQKNTTDNKSIKDLENNTYIESNSNKHIELMKREGEPVYIELFSQGDRGLNMIKRKQVGSITQEVIHFSEDIDLSDVGTIYGYTIEIGGKGCHRNYTKITNDFITLEGHINITNGEVETTVVKP